MSKDVYEFWRWVSKRMDELDISSYRQLERQAGFSNGAISVRKRNLLFPTVEIAEGLCLVLRVSWVQLWSQAGFIQHHDLSLDTLDGIDVDIFRALTLVDDDFKAIVLNLLQREISKDQKPDTF